VSNPKVIITAKIVSVQVMAYREMEKKKKKKKNV
jgi:hypothetical protein